MFEFFSSQQDAGLSSCMDNFASPAEFDGMNSGPEATPEFLKAFKTKKICQSSSKVILTK